MTEQIPGLKVPTRDGRLLTTDLYLPEGEGPWPALLHRTPYGSHWFADAAREFTKDVAVVVQNVSGRFGSDGDYDLGETDVTDGADAVAWIASQPWCDGRVAGIGISYGGYTQLRLASASPEGLVCIAPQLAGAWWKGLFFREPGGPLALATSAHWLPRQASDDTSSKEEFRNQMLSRALEFFQIVKDGKVSLEAALAHPAISRLPLRDPWPFEGSDVFSEIWTSIFDRPPPVSWFDDPGPSPSETITVPTLVFNGWYDMGVQGSIEVFRRLNETSPGMHKLVLAPMGHGEPLTEYDAGADGERFDLFIDNRWAREHLLDEGTELRDLEPVTYYTFHKGWSSASTWPPEGTQEQRWALHAGATNADGRLTMDGSYERTSIEFPYDPRHPVPTRGGLTLGMPPGPSEQSGLTAGARADVVSFTSDAFDESVEITGTVAVELYASSDAPDTDFTAKVIDVQPGGRAMSICDGIIRARYRNGVRAEMLVPYEVARMRIHCGSISYVVRKGHRLRVDISSSNFPRFDRNANTGNPEGTDREEDLRVANQTIHTSEQYPTRLTIGVMQ